MTRKPKPARTSAEICHVLRIRARTASLKEIGYEGDALAEAEAALNDTVDGSFSPLPDVGDDQLRFLIGLVVASKRPSNLVDTSELTKEEFMALLMGDEVSEPLVSEVYESALQGGTNISNMTSEEFVAKMMEEFSDDRFYTEPEATPDKQ